VELGHTASAINSYDEAWELAEYITPLLRKATGNAPLGDWFSFHVTAARPSGFVGPHRDKPMAAAETFREDGSPMYATVWVALSDATPESSCLYFIPKGDDPGAQGGKVTAVVLNVPQRWRVTALTAARLRTPARLHACTPTRLLNARAPAAGYFERGDQLRDVVLPSLLSWQNIVAQPAPAGSVLCFSHRVVHWGSKVGRNGRLMWAGEVQRC
jgi:hypothetical protein